jgi:ABC-type sugar transport system ATPase subunit
VSSPQSIISLSNVSKRYGNTRALEGIDLEIQSGQVTGIVGENGAGKSTLVKLLSGAEVASAGTVTVAGHVVDRRDPGAVYDRGVRVVYQEGSFVPTLPLLDNLFLLERAKARARLTHPRSESERASVVLQSVGLDPSLMSRPVSQLSRSQQQIAEVARCLVSRGSIVVLDEPTSALSQRDARRVLDAVRRVAAQGATVIYISHLLEDVMGVCDQIVVLRNGQLVQQRAASEWNPSSLVEAILGSTLDARAALGAEEGPRGTPHGDSMVLQLAGVSCRGLFGVNLSLNAGEVLGIAGLGGSGKSLLGRLIAGREKSSYDGTMTLCQRDAKGFTSRRLQQLVGYLSPDRASSGINPLGSISENLLTGKFALVSNSFGVIQTRRKRETVTASLQAYNVRYGKPDDLITSLSGGNQQKVLVARAYLGSPELVVLDEPTRGIDVGARLRIYDDIRARAAAGVPSVVISNDAEEIATIADRALIMRRGTIVSEIAKPTRENVYAATVG